ncbi:hypothetical protein CUPL110328_25460 [Cupriavidus plantarum]|nr:hypothetical protein LMG26296_05352 [Cupriavidus plantarum]SMR86856.1 hypothetical protein SAMN05421735_0017 [Cupriavidus plantarum]
MAGERGFKISGERLGGAVTARRSDRPKSIGSAPLGDVSVEFEGVMENRGVFEYLVKNQGNATAALLASIHYVNDVFRRSGVFRDLFVLIGDSTWQPNTRVVRHLGATGRRRPGGIDFGSPPEVTGLVENEEAGLKFFGMTKISADALDKLPAVLTAGACCYLVALPSDEHWRPSLEEGFSGDWRADFALISAIAEHGGILMRRVGFFDDPEIGLEGIADAAVLASLDLSPGINHS